MLMYFQKAIFYGFECLFIKHLERKAMKTFIKVITVTSVAMQLLAFSGPSLSRSPNSPNHQLNTIQGTNVPNSSGSFMSAPSSGSYTGGRTFEIDTRTTDPTDTTYWNYTYNPSGKHESNKWNNEGTGNNSMGPGDGFDVRPGQGANQGFPQNYNSSGKSKGKSPCFLLWCGVKMTPDGGTPNPAISSIPVLEIINTRLLDEENSSQKDCVASAEGCHNQDQDPNGAGLAMINIPGTLPLNANGLMQLPNGAFAKTNVFAIGGAVNIGNR